MNASEYSRSQTETLLNQKPSGVGLFPIPVELIARRIYRIRDEKVMLDSDLAELYQVPTKRLNESVERNLDRFPGDFMFQLSKDEFENWRSQIATSNSAARMGFRRPPYAFTEHGVAMRRSYKFANSGQQQDLAARVEKLEAGRNNRSLWSRLG